MIDVAVGFFTFNRIDTTMQVFEQIRLAQPTRLYLISDGPRSSKEGEAKKVANVRNWIESHIDWPCEVKKNYSEINLGCKNRMASGITWLFENEEMAIVLEDDVKPVQSFFAFAKEMLEKYKYDEKVMMVTGFNPHYEFKIKESYTFSRITPIWGWATWRRAWKKYDVNIKTWPENKKKKTLKKYFNFAGYLIASHKFDLVHNQRFDTWDYQWSYISLENNGLCVIPNVNMIENLGFGREDAVHTTGKATVEFITNNISFPLTHPDTIADNLDYSWLDVKKSYGFKTIIQKIIKRIVKV